MMAGRAVRVIGQFRCDRIEKVGIVGVPLSE